MPSEPRAEPTYVVTEMVRRLEANGTILPGVTNLAADIIRTHRPDSPVEAARAVFGYLNGPGRRYLNDPAAMDVKAGAAVRFLVDALPLNPAEKGAFYARHAAEVALHDLSTMAAELTRRLYTRDTGKFHASPPPPSRAEAKARRILALFANDVNPDVNLDELAGRWASAALGNNDRALIQAFASRLQSRGLSSKINVHEATQRFEQALEPVDKVLGAGYGQHTL